MNPLFEWWRGRVASERRILALGGGALLLLLVYLALWRPVMQERDVLRAQTAQARADVAWMRDAALEAQRLTAHRAGEGRALQETLNGIAAAPKIIPLPTQDGADGGTEVRFERVEAEALMRWFDRLRRDSAWVVRSARIERLEPGWVRARIDLLEPAR